MLLGSGAPISVVCLVVCLVVVVSRPGSRLLGRPGWVCLLLEFSAAARARVVLAVAAMLLLMWRVGGGDRVRLAGLLALAAGGVVVLSWREAEVVGMPLQLFVLRWLVLPHARSAGCSLAASASCYASSTPTHCSTIRSTRATRIGCLRLRYSTSPPWRCPRRCSLPGWGA